MSQRLILIGASVRAAAFSARAAGYEPWCADLFGDVDLQNVRMPNGLPAIRTNL